MGDLSAFKDRTPQIAAFDRLWEQEDGWILAFHGFSGLGKSTLLEWLEVKRCRVERIPHAAADLSQAGEDLGGVFLFLLEGIEERLPRGAVDGYRRKREAALQRLQQVRVSIQMEMHVQHSQEVGQSQAAGTKDLMREHELQAERELTDAWVEALRGLRSSGKLVFFFDNYDAFQGSAALETINRFWTALERAQRRAGGLRVVIAGREQPLYQNDIQALRRGLVGWRDGALEPFSERDSDELLAHLGVSDPAYRQAVYHRLAQGHPMVTRLAADAWNRTPGGLALDGLPGVLGQSEAIAWLNERLLNGLDETLCRMTEAAAMLRSFNAAHLSALLDLPAMEVERRFKELIRLSFVQLKGEGWSCHPLLRQVVLKYKAKENPEAFRGFHRRAEEYFREKDEPAEVYYHGFLGEREGIFDEWGNAIYQAGFAFEHVRWQALIDVGLAHELEAYPGVQAEALYQDGEHQYYLSKSNQARSRFGQALAIYQSTGDRLGQAACIQSLGDVHQGLGEYPQARERYHQALELFNDIGDRLGQANCIQSLGEVHQRLGEYPQARERYHQALELFNDIGDRLGQANCIKSLGNVHQMLDEYPQARERYHQALELFNDIGDQLGQANCIKSLGDVHQRLGEYPQARERYHQALELFNDIGDQLGQANCIQSLGNVHQGLGEYPQARERYQQALEIYQQIGDQLGQANCIQSLGDVHQMLGEYPQARERYHQALEIFNDIGDRLGQANCIQRLGEVHQRLGEYPQARERYQQALEIYQQIGEQLGQANCIQSLGEVHQMLDEYPQARERYQKALELYQQIGNRLGQAGCAWDLGQAAAVEGNWQEAESELQAAQALYHQLGLPYWQATVLIDLAATHEKQRKFQEALAVYSQIVALRPGEAWIILNRANLLLYLRDLAGAERDLQAAAALEPEHPYLFLRLAHLHLLRRAAEEARRCLEKAAAGLPEQAEPWFRWGELHLTQGDAPAAREAYEKALGFYPDSINLKWEIDELTRLREERAGHAAAIDEVIALLGSHR